MYDYVSIDHQFSQQEDIVLSSGQMVLAGLPSLKKRQASKTEVLTPLDLRKVQSSKTKTSSKKLNNLKTFSNTRNSTFPKRTHTVKGKPKRNAKGESKPNMRGTKIQFSTNTNQHIDIIDNPEWEYQENGQQKSDSESMKNSISPSHQSNFCFEPKFFKPNARLAGHMIGSHSMSMEDKLSSFSLMQQHQNSLR